MLKVIEVFGTKMRKAEPSDSVGLFIDGINDVERGEVISYSENKLKEVKSFVAEIILFSDIKIRNGDTLTIRCGTAEKKCEVQRISKEIDPVNLTVRKGLPETSERGKCWRGKTFGSSATVHGVLRTSSTEKIRY